MRDRPVRTTAPPLRVAASASASVAGLPTVSNTKSAPRPAVSSRTASATSGEASRAADRIGRAELPRDLQRPGPQIDRDDSLAAGDRGALHDVETDAAGADHRDARSLRHLPGVGDGADAGDHRAADRRQRVERNVARDRDRAAFRHDDEVGEAGGAEKRRQVLAARVQARRASTAACCGTSPSPRDRTTPRVLPGTARRRRRPAPSRGRRDRRPSRLVTAGPTSRTMPGTFVAEDERCLRRPVAARRMQVAVADAGGLELDQDFARARRVELGWFDGEGLALLPQDRGMNVHGCLDARL